MVVLIELVNEFNEPVLVSIELTRFFKSDVVVAILELKEPTLELNPLVVVATLELKSDVVVATLELKEPILEDKPLVVVAIEPDNDPILVDILELNVEYPVVPVIIT
jgi:hypothetical protein